jgi:hypothetical protein
MEEKQMLGKTITVDFDTDKLKALRFYAAKKGVDVEAELLDSLQKSYEKLVPASTREYIEAEAEPELQTAKSRPARNSRPATAEPPATTGTGENA